MKKSYCDKCGVEIDDQNRFRGFSVKVAAVAFDVAMEDAIPVEYDVCKYCVLDAIASTDDRPRVVGG